MVKKVVAINDCWISKIIEKENYVAYSLDSEIFTNLNDREFYYKTLKQKFKPLEEEMEIKVGSEWVNEDGLNFTVLFIEGGECFVKWEDGKRSLVSAKIIRNFCKPKPTSRTVWLNVYDDYAVSHTTKQESDSFKSEYVLFQQEVELIDPREGEKG